jgi:hypothetical protein
LAAAIFYFAFAGYGKISSKAYGCATALYGACKAEDLNRLEKVREIVLAGGVQESIGRFGEIEQADVPMSDQEKSWLVDIIATAKSGDWKSASNAAKRMMEDQVEH